MNIESKTFRLHKKTVAAMEELVRAGVGPTSTALVEGLIRREKLRLDRSRQNLRGWEDALRAEWISTG